MIKTDNNTYGAVVTDGSGTSLFFEQGFIFIDSGTGGEGDDYLLNEPVKISVFFDRDSREYILSNDDCHLLAQHSNLPDAIKIIQEQLGILFEEYVFKEDSKLHSSGAAFKKMLSGLLSVKE